MENHEHTGLIMENSPQGLPPLIRSIEESPADAFAITSSNDANDHHAPELQAIPNGILHNPRRHTQSVPITLPATSTSEIRQQSSKKVLFKDDVELHFDEDNPSARGVRFHSQPIPIGVGYDEAATSGKFAAMSGKFPNLPVRSSRSYNKLKDGRYNSFKTWTSKRERQASMKIRGQTESTENVAHPQEVETPSVHRYFDALRGPELDTLKPSEEILLPKDRRWPFLLRYPISSFGICLGISSQAILWKTLASTAATHFLHISLKVNLVLWVISVALWLTVSTTYILKGFFYFEAVRREYYHPIRVNFFFAPWIALLFLALGVPPSVAKDLPRVLWYILMAPIFCLELKIYGQWMSGGQRRLSKVANPSNHLSVVGNFVGALLGASMGLTEGPLFFFSIGVAHYMVLFVTLYQRLPTNETLPKELHPVFFLFVAAPSVASMAWAKIHGSFNNGARIPYFIALFLYFSLAVRLNFFRGFKFSLAWWAYTFPMTGAAIATIRYSNEVPNVFTKILAVALSSTATITVTGLLVTTFLHAFVFRDLFPNDIAIAISDHKPKPRIRLFHHNDDNDIEHYLKFASPDNKDVQVGVSSSPEITEAQNQRLSPVQENLPPRP